MVRKAVLPGRCGRRFRRCASTRPGGEGGDPARADCERDRADLAGPDGDDAHPAGAVRADADGPHPGAVDAHTDGAAADDVAAAAACSCRRPYPGHPRRPGPRRHRVLLSRRPRRRSPSPRSRRPAGRRRLRPAATPPPRPRRRQARRAPARRPSTTARPQRKALAARVQRSRNRVSVRLAFVLPKADRLFVIVRGPAPSCRIAGYIPVRGRKGANTVFFAGRVHGRRLEPGVYLLSLSTNRRLDPSGGDGVRSRRLASPLGPTT